MEKVRRTDNDRVGFLKQSVEILHYLALELGSQLFGICGQRIVNRCNPATVFFSSK
jgi:hypothetical protein